MSRDVGMVICKSSVVSSLPCLVAALGIHEECQSLSQDILGGLQYKWDTLGHPGSVMEIPGCLQGPRSWVPMDPGLLSICVLLLPLGHREIYESCC